MHVCIKFDTCMYERGNSPNFRWSLNEMVRENTKRHFGLSQSNLMDGLSEQDENVIISSVSTLLFFLLKQDFSVCNKLYSDIPL